MSTPSPGAVRYPPRKPTSVAATTIIHRRLRIWMYSLSAIDHRTAHNAPTGREVRAAFPLVVPAGPVPVGPGADGDTIAPTVANPFGHDAPVRQRVRVLWVTKGLGPGGAERLLLSF